MSAAIRIMVVEDDPDVSVAIAEALEDNGYAVQLAGNGHDALVKLRAASPLPHLILLDMMMPVMDGRQFRIEQRADPQIAGVPVVLLSAHIDLRAVAEEQFAAAYLKKPIDLPTLLAVIARETAHAVR